MPVKNPFCGKGCEKDAGDSSPPVTGLLAGTPFGNQPPRMLRVDVYRYRFTTPEGRTRTGDWWQREYLSPFYPLPLLGRSP